MSGSLYSVFAAQAAADRSKTFIERPDGSRITYGDVDKDTARIANILSGMGVAPGDRIAIQVDKSAEALLLYLACLRLGAVYIPFNTAYTLAELRYLVADAEPRLFVCRPDRAAEMAELGIQHLRTLGVAGDGTLLEGLARAETSFADHPCANDDLAAILYTSGTTGRSKGAMLSHGNLRSNAEVLKDFWRFTADDRLLHALPIFHTHGLFVATNIVAVAGASMLFLPSFDIEEILRLLPHASVMMGVPTFYTRLLAQPGFTADVVKNIRLFISGSAPLAATTHREFEARTGHAILERYGMTETNMNTSNPYEGERLPGSVGLPLPGTSIRIADPSTGAEVPPGEVGQIEIKGPNVFKGYWRAPEKTKAEFRADGYFMSGDLGFRDDRGYVHIVGRNKDLIISGGFNVYPAEVEAVIDEIEGVAQCAVIGAPHPDFGEAVIAVVVAKPGTQLDEGGITATVAERLANYKRPKRIIIVPELPLNTMGKVQKNILRERHRTVFQG
ncbi:malonate--CoA ligase [Taklimakanibacter lacteus]|uniref:malonate--CoA ligase n=1 Tax=Taklimakanibacter lacteus TaxID=2268456 RepID=UPI000E65F036